MRIDKCKKMERNKKMNAFEKKFEKEKSKKQQHKRITKVFNRNY